ncbi:MAG: hypothetical protein M1835_004142 [Candelina submexicana]|nr:MAG: hypothetical protein M1835_004142 [Candelina submexicana]
MVILTPKQNAPESSSEQGDVREMEDQGVRHICKGCQQEMTDDAPTLKVVVHICLKPQAPPIQVTIGGSGYAERLLDVV